MSKPVRWGIYANLIFWGFAGLVAVTNGVALLVLVVAFLCFAIFMIGYQSASEEREYE